MYNFLVCASLSCLVKAVTLTWRSGGRVGVIGVDGTNVPVEFLDGSRCILKIFPKTTASGVTAAMLREVCGRQLCWAASGRGSCVCDVCGCVRAGQRYVLLQPARSVALCTTPFNVARWGLFPLV